MKKKIFAIMFCIAMLAIAIVGGTIAYFTDTHEQTNTFTAGKVDIVLFEDLVKKDEDPNSKTFGDYISIGQKTYEEQKYHLYPAMTVDKNPTIYVNNESEDAYVAAIITVTGDISSLFGIAGSSEIDITRDNFVAGGEISHNAELVNEWNGLDTVYKTDNCVIYQDASNAAKNVWKLYVFVEKPKSEMDTVTLFEKLNISEKWDNAEMEKINGMEITVKAFATQTNGFADCYTAMTTAFPWADGFKDIVLLSRQ